MESYKKLLVALKEREDLNTKIGELANEVLAEICPYKIGDIVPICGYAHAGKQCEITAMHFLLEKDILVRGTLIKKNGTNGETDVKWTSWKDEKLKAALAKLT